MCSPPEKAQEAVVVMNDPKQITAIQQEPGAVWMYSFFPRQGLGFFTRHTSRVLLSEVKPHGALFHASCAFARQ